MRLAACLIVKSGTFLGLQAFKLLSSSRARMVSRDAAIFKPFLSYVAGLNGSFLLCRHNRLTSNGDITGFRPRDYFWDSTFLSIAYYHIISDKVLPSSSIFYL